MTAVVRLVCRCCWPGLVVPGKAHLSSDPCHAPLVSPYSSWARRKPGVSLNTESAQLCVVCCSAQSRLTLQPRGLWPARLLYPWDSPQEHWSGLPCPPPGNMPDPGIKLESSALAGGFFTTSTTWTMTNHKLSSP